MPKTKWEGAGDPTINDCFKIESQIIGKSCVIITRKI